MTRSASIKAWPSRSNGTARPPQRAAAASARSALRLVTRIVPGAQALQVLQGRLAHLAGADDQHRLVGERVEDLAGHVDRDAGDRQLPLVHAGLRRGPPCRPAAPPGRPVWKIGPTVLHAIGRLVGVADLAEDLPLAQDQALQAGRDPEQVPDDPLVVVADQVPRDSLGGHLVEPDQDVGQARRPRGPARRRRRGRPRPGCRSRGSPARCRGRSATGHPAPRRIAGRRRPAPRGPRPARSGGRLPWPAVSRRRHPPGRRSP